MKIKHIISYLNQFDQETDLLIGVVSGTRKEAWVLYDKSREILLPMKSINKYKPKAKVVREKELSAIELTISKYLSVPVHVDKSFKKMAATTISDYLFRRSSISISPVTLGKELRRLGFSTMFSRESGLKCKYWKVNLNHVVDYSTENDELSDKLPVTVFN